MLPIVSLTMSEENGTSVRSYSCGGISGLESYSPSSTLLETRHHVAILEMS